MFFFTSLINSFLLQSPPEKQPAPFFFPPTQPGVLYHFAKPVFLKPVLNMLMALHGISATGPWALLTLHDCTHQKVPSGALQLSVKSDHVTVSQLPVKSTHSSLPSLYSLLASPFIISQ